MHFILLTSTNKKFNESFNRNVIMDVFGHEAMSNSAHVGDRVVEPLKGFLSLLRGALSLFGVS